MHYVVSWLANPKKDLLLQELRDNNVLVSLVTYKGPVDNSFSPGLEDFWLKYRPLQYFDNLSKCYIRGQQLFTFLWCLRIGQRVEKAKAVPILDSTTSQCDESKCSFLVMFCVIQYFKCAIIVWLQVLYSRCCEVLKNLCVNSLLMWISIIPYNRQNWRCGNSQTWNWNWKADGWKESRPIQCWRLAVQNVCTWDFSGSILCLSVTSRLGISSLFLYILWYQCLSLESVWLTKFDASLDKT